MNTDVRLELSRLARDRQELLDLIAIAARDPVDALGRLRKWRDRLRDLADVRGEIGGLCALALTLQHLLAWGAAVRGAEADAARHLQAAKAEASVRVSQAEAGDAHDRAALAFLLAVQDLASYEQLQPAADLFAAIPVRTSLTKKKGDGRARTRGSREKQKAPPPVIDLAVTIDGEPWVGPRLLRLNHAHHVRLTGTLSHRPPDLRSVTVTALGTIGADVISWPPEITFTAKDFAPTATCEFAVVGRATTDFRAGQELRLSARLKTKDEERSITAIGLRTLQPVITDRAFSTMGTGTVPLQFVEVVREIERREVRPDIEHRSDFEQLVRALLEFQLSTLAGGDYRDTEDRLEREFQVDVRRFLHARLGVDDVYEGERAGGGEFDLRYRTVPNELKVERETANLEAIARKYSGQASQYPAVRGRQLSVLTVLEVTKKREPVANIANYVRVIDRVPPAAGDLEKPVPVITVLVVIPANYPRPSDLT